MNIINSCSFHIERHFTNGIRGDRSVEWSIRKSRPQQTRSGCKVHRRPLPFGGIFQDGGIVMTCVKIASDKVPSLWKCAYPEKCYAFAIERPLDPLASGRRSEQNGWHGQRRREEDLGQGLALKFLRRQTYGRDRGLELHQPDVEDEGSGEFGGLERGRNAFLGAMCLLGV